MPAIEITASVTIARPASDVFEFLADMSNNTLWQKGMQECRWTSQPPVRIGSTYEQVAHFRGKEIVSSFEVAELEPGRRIRIVSTRGPIPLDITRTVEPTNDGNAAVTAMVKGDTGGMFRLAAPFMSAIVGRSIRADYRRLKALLEQG